MGKTFKRNSFRKPKHHGRTFEKKKEKWNPHKHHKPKAVEDDFVESQENSS